ncbi:DNA repair exonuclease [Virgibacillus profundi]|uniref:DNA repair exonuclease n=1 Tax=Virgibacillus profundi TaxID=2024555 RepID=A0A2A2ICF2_9BACI|nr:DNA repair exonuclease [Virgibacillus profundi]PAV29307.1 DNA repair exonuclease [Virgibacillus profundi]PXY53476.1 DNA repair exonuclease [Virgibacillus profundi]
MENQISFIHAADLHLDSPFKGLANLPEHIFQDIRESTFTALDRLVKTAIAKKVDFVLISGDLFDNEKQSLKAQIRLRHAFESLKEYHINVYLSYGNHDYIKGNIHPVTYPDNVFIFPDEKISQFTYITDEKQMAAIYGFSYENRAVLANKALEYQITEHHIPFHIALLHGSIASNTQHDVYAPFQLSDLVNRNFDYWALGHIHQREILKEDPPVVYPGNIQGRNRKEIGEKGCYHVILSEINTEMTFIPLQAIQFQTITIDVSACLEVHQIELKIEAVLKGQQSQIQPQLIQLTLVSDSPTLKQWDRESYLEDIIELVNESFIHHENWSYIFKYTIQMKNSSLDQSIYKGEHFIGELAQHFEQASIQPFIKELYHQKQVRKYIDPLTKEEEQTIKQEAQQMLLAELLKD